MTEGLGKIERIGSVQSATGDLVVVDFGLLAHVWSGGNTPVVELDGIPEDIATAMNSAVDHEIVGPDAQVVADHLAMQVRQGRYVFDWPTSQTDLVAEVKGIADQHGLDAACVPVDRMPHRQRVASLLAENPDGIEVPFHGMWAGAVRGVTPLVALPVYGQWMDPAGPYGEMWHSVWVQSSANPVVRSEFACSVLVDQARLLFADPDALAHFATTEPEDGFLDLLFWGADGAQIAETLSAPAVGQDRTQVYGWTDITQDEVNLLGPQIVAEINAHELTVAIDVRPHDAHYKLLSQIRSRTTQAGGIAVGAKAVTGFMTTWGDGIFSVFRDLDANNDLCRVRVELGTPEAIERLESVNP